MQDHRVKTPISLLATDRRQIGPRPRHRLGVDVALVAPERQVVGQAEGFMQAVGDLAVGPVVVAVVVLVPTNVNCLIVNSFRILFLVVKNALAQAVEGGVLTAPAANVNDPILPVLAQVLEDNGELNCVASAQAVGEFQEYSHHSSVVTSFPSDGHDDCCGRSQTTSRRSSRYFLWTARRMEATDIFAPLQKSWSEYPGPILSGAVRLPLFGWPLTPVNHS